MSAVSPVMRMRIRVRIRIVNIIRVALSPFIRTAARKRSDHDMAPPVGKISECGSYTYYTQGHVLDTASLLLYVLP